MNVTIFLSMRKDHQIRKVSDFLENKKRVSRV